MEEGRHSQLSQKTRFAFYGSTSVFSICCVLGKKRVVGRKAFLDSLDFSSDRLKKGKRGCYLG
jgi:hypothetical protein